MNANNATSNPWLDGPRSYGRISRALHWAMALLFLWQFMGMIMKIALGLNPRDSWIIGTHPQVGFILMVLMLVRAFWAFCNIRRRPSHGVGFVALSASLGHFGLYVLMLLVPLTALVRAWANGRGFEFLHAIPIFSPGQAQPEILHFINLTRESTGFSVHGLLGWLLLLLIVGHIAMVIVHQWIWRDGTLNKMLGKPR